jgi:trehalose synthase-fused probable maltokinase
MSHLTSTGPWMAFVEGDSDRCALEAHLVTVLPTKRWYREKARTICRVQIDDYVAIRTAQGAAYLIFLEVTHRANGHEDHEDKKETYLLPLAFAMDREAEAVRATTPWLSVADACTTDGKGLLFDAVGRPAFLRSLLELFARGASIQTVRGRLDIETLCAYATLARMHEAESACDPEPARRDQTNTSIAYGTTFMLKLLRRLDDGASADLEVTRFLTDGAGFPSTPMIAGSLTYTRNDGASSTLGILQRFVANRGDAWAFVASGLARHLTANAPFAEDESHDVLAMIGVLGRRTAEMHRALAYGAKRAAHAAFAPEPLDSRTRYRLVHATTRALSSAYDGLRQHEFSFDPKTRARVASLLACRSALDARLATFATLTLDVVQTRIHGDFHLGQILVTDDDIAIIDFEGEPSRTTAERRAKRSPLADVAGMIRSFHYAAMSALAGCGNAHPDVSQRANAWYERATSDYLAAYFSTIGNVPVAPLDLGARDAMLAFYLIEKCIYEIGYELNNRPAFLPIPIEGLLSLTQTPRA